MMDFIYYILYRLDKILGISTYTLNFNQLLIPLAVLVSVFLIELLGVGWSSSSLKKLLEFKSSIRTDVVCWLLDWLGLTRIIGFIFSFGLFYWVAVTIDKHFKIHLIHYIANPVVQFTIIFVINDLRNYVNHRLFHSHKTLWALHEFHHSATSLNIFSRNRDHFYVQEITRLFDALPYVIFGGSIYTYFWVQLLTEAHGYLIHSEFRSKWGWLGRYILVSPKAHYLHHSADAAHYNKNLGSVFIVWDRLFGTYLETDAKPLIGPQSNFYNTKGYVYEIIKSAQFALKTLVQRN
jgi:sterol desaturase/sphingolipid hydroxylase (fatty acid hydroxylase superfamily)